MALDITACPLTKGERILAPLDGSEYSDRALDQAISMAKICNSEVFVLSVVQLYPGQLAVAPALEEKMSAETREILENATDKLEKENLRCETIVRIGGQPHEFIIQEAKEAQITPLFPIKD